MIIKAKAIAISLATLITIAFIGYRIVWDFKTWQCIHIPVQPETVEPQVEADIEQEWAEYHALATAEYADEFTALFNSYTYKLSRNGRSMINGKFVKMGA